MAHTKFTSAYLLSFIIIILAIVASAGGLLLQDLYRDNLWVTSQWQGNDFVTLVVAVPVLVGFLEGEEDDSRRVYPIMALEMVTGESFGDCVVCWQDWWDEQQR